MKRLTKDQVKRHGELLTRLDEARDAFRVAAERYNEIIDDLNALGEEVAGAIQEYIDARSERWQESDAAGQYQTWLDAWNSVAELGGVDEPDAGDDAYDVLEQAPLSAEDAA